jgi:putative chitobiose transport system permease protein
MTAWLLLALPALLLVVLYVVPTLWALVISLQDYSQSLTQPVWAGWRNYQYLFNTAGFWHSLWITLLFTAVTLPAMIWLPLPLAMALHQPLRGQSIYRVLAYIPVVAPLVAVSIAWKGLYAFDGVLNQGLNRLGLPGLPWLSDPAIALWAIVVMVVWKGMAYYGMMYLTQLLQADPQLTEAALLDGASAWQRFVHVTLPHVRPVMRVVSLICLLGCFKAFTEFYVMTQGGPMGSTTTWLYWIYQHGFQQLDLGTACAGGLILMAVLGSFTLLQQRLSKTGT